MAQNGGGTTRFHRVPGTAIPIGSLSSSSSSSATTMRNPSPLLPITIAAALSTASSSSSPTTTNHFDRGGGDVITLAQPRPGIDRVRNEYIETPLRPTTTVSHHPLLLTGNHHNHHQQQQQQHHNHHHHHSNNHHRHHIHQNLPILPIASKGSLKLDVSGRISPCLPHTTNVAGVHRPISGSSHPQRFLSPSSSSSSNNTQLILPITAQPLSSSSSSNRMLIGAFTNITTKKKSEEEEEEEDEDNHRHHHHQGSNKEGARMGLGGGLVGVDHEEERSIICHECKRCKCDACRKPRPLPATWICGNKYQCSAETFVETCSCMCCVKGLFYHCAKDCEMDDDVSCADRPCACGAHRRCSRFACIALLSTLLPCLFCYWPLRGCLRLCELCYTKYHSQGCQCVKRNVNNASLSSTTPTSSSSSKKGASAAAAMMALTQQQQQQDARQRNNKMMEPSVRSGKSKRLLDAQID